ncbi:MAG: hypothetical protein II627_05425, partial [Lachnospiraceae bacterium]|nr:hypothetical protein [Lachnospiraceae bacterium]
MNEGSERPAPEDVRIYDPSAKGNADRSGKKGGSSGWWYEPEPGRQGKRRRWAFLEKGGRKQRIAGLDAL